MWVFVRGQAWRTLKQHRITTYLANYLKFPVCLHSNHKCQGPHHSRNSRTRVFFSISLLIWLVIFLKVPLRSPHSQLHCYVVTNHYRLQNNSPLSVQRLGGGHTSSSPFFLTTWLSRALTYWFDATPPETTCKRYQKDQKQSREWEKTEDTW